MKTFAVEFMLEGHRVGRLFITAMNKKHAEVLAMQRLPEELDEMQVTEL